MREKVETAFPHLTPSEHKFHAEAACDVVRLKARQHLCEYIQANDFWRNQYPDSKLKL